MVKKNPLYDGARIDHRIICGMVKKNSRILDLGCGNGELMLLLSEGKSAKAQGIELKEEAIYECVEKGLNVFHGDIDQGLIEYPDKAFDYVIINQSMQETRKPGYIINEALRVAKNVIIGFPNFASLRARSRLFFRGKTPITASLPYCWHDTPNLHFLTISDFRTFCKEKNIDIFETVCFNQSGRVRVWPNLFAENAIFLIRKDNERGKA